MHTWAKKSLQEIGKKHTALSSNGDHILKTARAKKHEEKAAIVIGCLLNLMDDFMTQLIKNVTFAAVKDEDQIKIQVINVDTAEGVQEPEKKSRGLVIALNYGLKTICDSKLPK